MYQVRTYMRYSLKMLQQVTAEVQPRLAAQVNTEKCEYDRWVVDSQLCKLRDTSDTLIERARAMFHL